MENDLLSLKILSLHEGVVNLLNQDTNYLVSLIQDEKNMTGMSLHIPYLSKMNKVIPEIGKNINLNEMGINYMDAEIWPGFITSASKEPEKRIQELNILKRNITSGNSFFALLTHSNSTIFQKKAKAILTNKIHINNERINGLENLVGLGQGLTPSGDDFITGALLAEKWLKGPIEINKQTIKRILKKTTYAGRTLLFLALEGSFPAYLITFLKELTNYINENAFLAAINRASQHGATSGMDSLAGFYWYIDYISYPKS